MASQSQPPYASAKQHPPITLKGKHLKTLIGFSCWHFWNAFKLLEILSLSLDNCMNSFSRNAFTFNNGFDYVLISWWKGRLFIRLFGGKITNAYSSYILWPLTMRHIISLSITKRTVSVINSWKTFYWTNFISNKLNMLYNSVFCTLYNRVLMHEWEKVKEN